MQPVAAWVRRARRVLLRQDVSPEHDVVVALAMILLGVEEVHVVVGVFDPHGHETSIVIVAVSPTPAGKLRPRPSPPAEQLRAAILGRDPAVERRPT
jgi:hypothetical protein